MTDNLNSIVPMLKTMPYTIKSTAKPEFLPKTENDILQLNEKNKKKETIKYVSMATGIVLAIIAVGFSFVFLAKRLLLHTPYFMQEK